MYQQGRCSICDDFTEVAYDSNNDAFVCDLCLMDDGSLWDIDWGDIFNLQAAGGAGE